MLVVAWGVVRHEQSVSLVSWRTVPLPRRRPTDERATPAGRHRPRLHPARRGRQRGLAGRPQGPQGDRVLLPGRPDAGLYQAGLRLHGQPLLLADAGYDVIGVSPDKPEKLAKFREKEHLKVTLVGDPDKETLTAYGAFGEKKLYGKTVTGVIRSTVVVDEEGKVEHAFYNVKATGHVAKIIKDLGI